MPASIEYKNKDPNGLGRGAGIYYRRSATYKGKRYPGGYYSKYSRIRDQNRKSKGYNIHKIGMPRGTKIPQTSDGNLRR
jgi:hypothetical protein